MGGVNLEKFFLGKGRFFEGALYQPLFLTVIYVIRPVLEFVMLAVISFYAAKNLKNTLTLFLKRKGKKSTLNDVEHLIKCLFDQICTFLFIH